MNVIRWCLLFQVLQLVSEVFVIQAKVNGGWTVSYNISVYPYEDGNFDDIQRYFVTENVPIFSLSATSVAKDVCRGAIEVSNSINTACLTSVANDIRINRVVWIQNFIYSMSMMLQTPEDPTLARIQMRKRDNEMFAVMKQLDTLDLTSKPGEEAIEVVENTVCFVGSEMRLPLLLTMLSFESVTKVYYFSLFDSSVSQPETYFTEDEWGHVDKLVTTSMMNIIIGQFPNKRIGILKLDLNPANEKTLRYHWQQYGLHCNLIVLPSDFEVLHYGDERISQLIHATLGTLSLDKSVGEGPIVFWVSDLYHEDVYEVTCPSTGCDHTQSAFDTYRNHFVWSLQETWAKNAVLIGSGRDSEGLPYITYAIPQENMADGLATSSVYIGRFSHLPQLRSNVGELKAISNKYEDRKVQTLSDDVSIEKDNILFLLTYDLRIYAETARGLKYQLQNELGYPHVIIVPDLSLEIVDVVNEYLVDFHQEKDAHIDVDDVAVMHVVQVILTPHYPGARLVSSLRYSLNIDSTVGMKTMEVLYSYVVVQYEQEWFFKELSPSFLGGVPLLHNARGIWTFSELQREAMYRIYAIQINLENQALQAKRALHHDIPSDYFDLRHHKPNPHIIYGHFVDIVPIFAPCDPHMPCHSDFKLPRLNSFYPEKKTLLFYGMCSADRIQYLQALDAQLDKDNALHKKVSLLHNCQPHSVNTGVMGSYRDRLTLNRSSLLLNINNFNESVLEMHRLMYLLSMGKCIISQRGRDVTLSTLAALHGAVYFVETPEEVIQTLAYLLTPTFKDNREQEQIPSKTRKWLQDAHGEYQRLAACEQRSLEAYILLHGQGKANTGEDISIDRNYGPNMLRFAMNKLRSRLSKVQTAT